MWARGLMSSAFRTSDDVAGPVQRDQHRAIAVERQVERLACHVEWTAEGRPVHTPAADGVVSRSREGLRTADRDSAVELSPTRSTLFPGSVPSTMVTPPSKNRTTAEAITSPVARSIMTVRDG